MNKVRYGICSLLCMTIGFLYGQQSELYVKQLPAEMAWWNHSINEIVQDSQGMIWMATWGGLARFDGYTLQVFRQDPERPNGLQGNQITSLFIDSQQRLWIGMTYTGLQVYDPRLDLFTSFRHDPHDPQSLSHDNVWAIEEDRWGSIWVGTESGLNRLDEATGNFTRYGKEQGLSHEFVYSLAKDQQEHLWIGTETGLNRLILTDSLGVPAFFSYELTPQRVSRDDSLRHNFIYTLCPSQTEPHVVWVGTSIGLKKITYTQDSFEAINAQSYYSQAGSNRHLSHHFVSDLFEDNQGKLWIATYGGLNQLDIRTEAFQHFFSEAENTSTIKSNVVRSLFGDRAGELWIGTQQGISWAPAHNKPFRRVALDKQQLENQTEVSVIQAAHTRPGFWVATNGGGLSWVTYPQWEQQHYTLQPPEVAGLAGFISSMIIDRENQLWLGTHGAGILKLQEQDIPNRSTPITQLQQLTKSNQLSDDYVMSLLESQSGDVWIGYWDDGLDRYDASDQQIYHTGALSSLEIDLNAYPIVAMEETEVAGERYLWVGTRGNGLLQMQFDSVTHTLRLIEHFDYASSPEHALSNNFITCLFEDRQQNLWVGTGGGLNQLNLRTGAIRFFLEKEGLKSNTILAVQEDKEGGIWVTTGGGLSHFPSGTQHTVIRNFDSDNGFQNDLFRANTAGVTSEGELLFGTTHGLTFFRPEEIQIDSLPPQVNIVDLRLANQSVPIGRLPSGRTILPRHISSLDRLELTHEDNVISLAFSGIYFSEPRKVQYAYQLEGFDPDWVYTDASNRIAHYTNLPYQDFVFKVKAANGDGIWSPVVSLPITIHPPFWRTRWAYALYVFATLALLYGVFRILQMRTAFRHRLQLERVEREKLEELNDMKLRFFTNVSHELRTPLTLIISPLEQLIKERKADKKLHQSFRRMHHNANRLLTMINQLLDIRKSEAGLMKLKVAEGNFVKFIREITLSFKGLAQQKGISFKFQSDRKQHDLWFDRDQMEKVLFNLLSNAFKYTPSGGNIWVEICQDTENASLKLKVSDTGIGIPAHQLTHIFQRFYQVENQQVERKYGGTGIGLALSKSIVDAHQGTIEVTSEEGVGTTFWVSLPLGEAHFSSEEKMKDFQNSESIGLYVQPDYSEEGLTITQQFLHKQGDLTLLIVEDNADIRSYLRENLEGMYRIEEAENGQVALEKAMAHPPDLVVSDIAMPVMDGIELCNQLKSNLITSHVPVILLTARTSLIFKVDGFENGADDYVTKPFNMRLLATRIKNLIDSRRLLQTKFSKSSGLQAKEVVLHSLDEQFLEAIRTEIEAHMDDPNFTVEALAEGVNMSRMQLYRKLKALTGHTPNQVIRGLRLQRAAQLLKSRQYNVSEVTYMVGYNDLKSFREQFKKSYGTSPSQYVTQ